MFLRFAKFPVSVFTLFLVADVARLGTAVEPADATPPAVRAGIADWIRAYEADQESVSRFFNLPASSTGLDRLDQLQKTWLDRLKTVDFAGLSTAGKIDYLLLQDKLQQTLEHLDRRRRNLAEMDGLLPFRQTIERLEEARWRAESLDCRAAAAQLDALTAQVKKLCQRVEKGKKPKGDGSQGEAAKPPAHRSADEKPGDETPLAIAPPLALRTAAAVSALRGSLKNWYNFYDGYEPQFSWWMKRPHQEADGQLEAYAKLLREEVALCKGKEDDPLVGDPIGAAAVAADIRFEFLPYTAEELIAIGQQELNWCEEQMKAASRAMGLGDDWKGALAKVKADFVPPGQQGELVAQIGREATQFVKIRHLVDVPPLCEQTWRLTMSSPEVMKTIPYAAYSGQQMLVAYAKDEMKFDDKLMTMRGNNRHFTRLVTAHELIPGHHLQLFYAARNNTQRELFSTPFYVEGWALYWELRLWDLGWANTPEDRIGMLFWRMTRAARIIVSLKFHLGQMKPDEMVNFLVERVGHEKLGATSEVRRFIGDSFSPLYQCGYLLGGRQLYVLHAEWVGTGKMTEAQFHDAVLRQNAIPIELLRAELLALPLAPDMQPAWRFAEEKPAGP
jgi:uncharacterized protein (DUF885 family)